MSVVVSEPSATGTTTGLVMWSVGDPGRVVSLLGDTATGRGLSGGVHAWSPDGTRVYAVIRAGGITELSLEGDVVVSQRAMALDPARSWSTPHVNAAGDTLHAVADWREVWSCDVATGGSLCVHRADAFAIDCVAGGPVRFHTWDRPHMPWTTSRVHPDAEVNGVAVQQPGFSHDGRSFAFIDDSTGVNNVRITGDHLVPDDAVIIDDCEHGGPTWGPGQRTWCFNSDATKVAYVRNELGFGSLWVYDRLSGERTQVGRAVHGCLSWHGDTLAALRSGARTPQQVVVYDMSNPSSPARTVVATGGHDDWSLPGFDEELTEPTLHSAPGSHALVPYRLFSPAQRGDKVIVWVHGGPTDQWQVTFRPRIPFWTSRGWSVVVVDHRGSTGHGRAFMQALHGGWGDADTVDTLGVVRHVQRENGFSASRTVLMGGSAGGLTVLNTAASAPGEIAAVVATYPVVDLGELMRGDDPFETHYVPELVGTTDEDELMNRSPIGSAASLARVPVLLFHGDNDTSVPLVHSTRLRDAVAAAGGSVRLEVMAGEGHGFRNPANVLRELEITESFIDAL